LYISYTHTFGCKTPYEVFHEKEAA